MSVAELVAADPAEFRKRLHIECNGEVRLLETACDPWQRADFEALDGGWQMAVGRPVTRDVRQLAYLERGRGHSKTSDIAAMATWALNAAVRPILGVAAAATKDQARILRDAISSLVRLNTPLKHLDVQNDQVINTKTKARLQILASDANTLYGILPDFIVCDELTHWGDSGELVWHSLFSASAKKSSCMLVIISNAGSGIDASWQWNVREMARTSDRWYFNRLDGPVASWLSPQRLEEQRHGLTALAYDRLWLNRWTEGVGDAVTAEMVDAARTLRGPMERRPDDTWLFLAGADLGVKNDFSSVVTLGMQYGSDQIHLADCHVWKPTPGNEVELVDVAKYIGDLHQRFHLRALWFDPHQALMLAQLLRRTGLRCEEMSFSSAARRAEMATALLGSLSNGQLQLYDHPQLIRDLLRLRIEERACNIRLAPPANTGDGHCDAAIALSIVLPEAMRLASTRAYTERRPPECLSARSNDHARFGILFDPVFQR